MALDGGWDHAVVLEKNRSGPSDLTGAMLERQAIYRQQQACCVKCHLRVTGIGHGA